MKIGQRSWGSLGVLGVVLLTLSLPPGWMDSRGWAEEKIAGAAPEIMAPKGTLDAITAILTRRSIRD